MAEYIERKTFLKDIEERYCLPCKEAGKDHNGCMCRACWVDDMCGEVIDAPAADVAPVVRCKDCLFLESGENECESWEWCKALHREMPPHAFCSLGERKGDSDDEAD
nr:MAG TPA_asm: hypothetical protein [Bacteriophage sp.]